MKAKSVFFLAMGLLMLTGGCAVPGYNAQQNQALNKAGGAAIGAVAGQAIGRSTKGTLIGAGAGYLLGDLISPFIAPGDNGGYAPPPPQQGPPPAGAGNCYWRQETDWGPDGRPHQIQRRVCEGETPWHPGQY